MKLIALATRQRASAAHIPTRYAMPRDAPSACSRPGAHRAQGSAVAPARDRVLVLTRARPQLCRAQIHLLQP